MGLPTIDPPLINSASPWATTEEDLQALFDCLATGAVTTRTSLLSGFEHNPDIHQYVYFNSSKQSLRYPDKPGVLCPSKIDADAASLNTLGYSPYPLRLYLINIAKVIKNRKCQGHRCKPWIISVTGNVEEVTECYKLILDAKAALKSPLCMEVNLSCPNIPGKPPPAYSKAALSEYLQALSAVKGDVPIGFKTPPYTYHDQYQAFIDALLEHSSTVDFITSTNTLGSSLVLNPMCIAMHPPTPGSPSPALQSASGLGIGGMAGPPLHPLSLGNVRTIRTMLDQHDCLRQIDIIGVGGVHDRDGFKRMITVGAKVVALATALGTQGVDVFDAIVSPRDTAEAWLS